MAINFLKSIMPSVYIKGITLENSSKTKFDERNPHIDSDREPDKIKNLTTGKIETQIITPDLAKKNFQSDMLIVNIDLLMKEKLDGDSLIASWFGNEEFLKYLKVCIVQSRDEVLTEKLISNKIDIDISNPRSMFSLYRTLADFKTILMKEVIRQPIQGQQLLEGNSILDQYESYNDDDGSRVFDIDFRLRFDIKNNANPKHLSYFAFSYLDVEQMAKDYQMDIDLSNFKTPKGSFSSEIVIDNFNVVSQTFIFVDEQNNIWDGDVHKLDNGTWKTNEEETNGSKILQLKTITNTKISDFRSMRDLEKMELDFSFIENEDFLGNSIKILTNDRLDIERKTNYFSSFSLSRDSEGNCRFLFGIDYLNLVKENTIFGKLYKDDSEELLKNVKIRNLKVYRVRTSNNYKTAIPNSEGFAFYNEDEDIPELVAFSKEMKSGEFNKNSYGDNGVIREVQIELDNVIPGIRYFTGIDKKMKDVTFGFYKYFVELEIEDNTNKLLTNKLDLLLNSYEMLKEFNNEANSNSVDTSKLEEGKVLYFRKNTTTNFNPYTGHFSNAFIETQEAKYKNEINPMNIPWIGPGAIYLQTINLFLSNKELIKKLGDIKKYSEILVTLIHPRTGTVDGIQIFLRLMETLINKIGSMVGTTISGKVNKWTSGDSTTKPSSTLSRGKVAVKTFLVKCYSDMVFDCDIPKDIGYDFFSITGKLKKENNSDGLFVVGLDSYEKRVEVETLKYFKNINVDINLKTPTITYTQDDNIMNTKYSFLSPSNINMGEERKLSLINPSEQIAVNSEVAVMATNIMKFNSLKNSPQLPLIGKKLNSNNVNININEFNIASNLQSFATNIAANFHSSDTFLGNRNESPYLENVKKEIIRKNTLSSSQISNVVVEQLLPHISEEQKNSYLLDAKDYIGTGSIFSQGDNLQDDMEDIEGIGSSKEESSKPTKINTLMMAIFTPSMEGGVKSNLSFTSKEKNNIGIFDLNKEENVLSNKNIVNNVNSSIIGNTRNSKNSISVVDAKKQDYIKKLPNQLKSIFLSSISSDKINTNWFSNREKESGLDISFRGTTLNVLKDPNNLLKFKLNYNTIKQVEVLVGFKNNIIKEQIWETLTPEKLEKAKRKNLLCRLKNYVNNDLNIKFPQGLHLPTYNEYFILSLEDKIMEVKRIEVNLSTRLNSNLVELNKQITSIPRIEFARSLIRTNIKSINTNVTQEDIRTNNNMMVNPEMQNNNLTSKAGR
jgi:hypothetical protein